MQVKVSHILAYILPRLTFQMEDRKHIYTYIKNIIKKYNMVKNDKFYCHNDFENHFTCDWCQYLKSQKITTRFP